MSPKNDFKAFSINNNANVVSQGKYEEEQSLKTGFPPNNVTTHVLNKVLRQSSTMASVVANFISIQSGNDVKDNGDMETINKAFTDSLKNHTKEQFTSQLSSNGYQKFPSGLILQWGIHSFKVLTENTVILPTSFHHACLAVVMIDTGRACLPMAAACRGSLNSFQAWVSGRANDYLGNEWVLTPNDPPNNINGQYLAIGF
ncbi:gp53-like domain-containing protein [Photorhabdus akhurstii]|uniref:gp53-like domain-containing protein n=1 Tax=Photorhabdus akhurstii TaxID=171438 RepID=UPI000A46262F